MYCFFEIIIFEILSFSYSQIYSKSGMVTYSYNLSTGEAEVRNLLSIIGWSGLQGESVSLLLKSEEIHSILLTILTLDTSL